MTSSLKHTQKETQVHWLTLSEAHALLGVSRKALYRYMEKQYIPYKKAANGRRYIKQQDLKEFKQTQYNPELNTIEQGYTQQ